jgi:hypothetical protein
MALATTGNNKNASLDKLYKHLRSRTDDKKNIIQVNVDWLCSMIRRLSADHAKIILLLIIHHHETENTVAWTKVPYNGSTGPDGIGVLFHLKDIPITLQKIISIYIQESQNSNLNSVISK